MKVRIDHEANRLITDFAPDLMDERSRSRRLGVRIDDDDVFGTHEDCGVAVDLCLGMRMREKDSFGGLFEVKEISGGGWRGRVGPGGTMVRQLQRRGAGQRSAHQHAEKIAARTGLNMIVLSAQTAVSV
jgi:hypothetical protein